MSSVRPTPGRGRLIAVEGLDGVGKTTLSRGLAVALGATWTTTPDPVLRADREALERGFIGAPRARAIFYASTVLAVSERAEARLATGRDLVVDRYWLSTWAYAQLLPEPPPLRALEDAVWPADVTIFLEAAESERRRRLQARGMTALDRASLDVGNAGRLATAYRRASFRRVAGRALHLDTTQTSVDASVASLLLVLDAAPSAAG